jgi:Mg/Co/Ni transporter MgtE
MINNMMYLPSDLTGAQANEVIRDRLKDTDFTSLVFVVDNEADRSLRGTVSLRNLLTMDESDTLVQIMDPYVDSFDPFQAATAAAYRILDSGLPAMPVVEEGRLIGAMTVDAAIAKLVPATSELNTLRIFS